MRRILLALLMAAAPLAAAQAPKLRALIFSGRNNHDWRATTPHLKKLLIETGRFDVRVNEEPEGASAATLAPYDLLVIDYCGARWGELTEKALERWLATGKGLVIFHAASYPFGDAPVLGDDPKAGKTEPVWPEYRKMVGAYWSKSEKPITGHGPRHSFQVKWTRPDHPIAAGQPASFWATDELYHNFRMLPSAEVLATAFDDPKYGGNGNDTPILWTVAYGKGRVFHTALGHNLAAIQEPGFETSFARGAEWAATGAVQPPAQKAPKTRLLVVTGGHAYDTTFYTLFEGYPDLAWTHETTIRTAFRKDIRENFDTVLFYNMEQELNDAGRKNLQDFVESGKGVITLHHAAANFNHWPWWYEQVSGVKYFLKAEPGHAASTFRHDIELFVIPAAKHPVVGDVGPMHFIDEGYKGMWISPKAQVLYTTEHPDADKPSVWVMPHEKARLVTILLGHDHFSHVNGGFRRLVKNAIDWTAARK